MTTSKPGLFSSFPSSPLPEKDKGNHFIVDLYIRVSTFSQVEGDSLEEQESELRKFCIYRNFQIHRIYVEEGKSGGTTKRPEYQKMIRDIEQQKVHAVVVKKLDRLSRSLLDFEQLMILMQTHEIEFISLRENFDTTTAMGKAMLRMALVFAQLEREQTSERVADVMHYRATLGHHNGGKTPLGYAKANKELVIVQKDRLTIEVIFDLFLKTQSVAEIVNHLNTSKIPSPTKQVWIDTYVMFLLKNPIYKGFVTWKKQVFQGLHPPIISPLAWDKVQDIFHAKKASISRMKQHALLQKLAVCGICNNPLIPSYAYNRTKTKYSYYRCGSTLHGKHRRKQFNCTFKYVSFPDLHTRVQAALYTLASPHYVEIVELKISDHNLILNENMDSISKKMSLGQDELSRIKAKKNEYVDVLITKQFSTQDHHRIHDRMNVLDQDERKLQGQLAGWQLEQAHLQDQLIGAETFKRNLMLLLEIPESEPKRYYSELRNFIKSIIVTHESLTFVFKDLPWPFTIPDNTS